MHRNGVGNGAELTELTTTEGPAARATRGARVVTTRVIGVAACYISGFAVTVHVTSVFSRYVPVTGAR